MSGARRLTLALAATLSAAPALAQHDPDLDLIPESVRAAPELPDASAPARGDARQRLFIENAVTVNALRHTLVPAPPPAPPNWQERLLLDARKEWALGSDVSLAYSGRLNLEARDEQSFPEHRNIRHDFREGFASWQPLPGSYLDAGRINLKSGVALGFNPTDFFKTRAVVEPLSADPAVLREDRLGTLMVMGQQIFEGGTLTLAYAPGLYRPSKVYTESTLRSFDPMFDRTNAHDRVLLKGSARVVGDLSPELLVYHEGERTQFGANLAESLGQRVVLYGEWAGGRRQSLIAEALRYGVDTGTLPGNAPSPLPDDTARHFQNDLSLGGSYTTDANIVLNLEYHFHQAGFSAADWRNWRAAGEAGPRAIAAELWFIRAYAAEQQEPVATHALFLRADWANAFVPHLELSGFANVDLHDGSTLLQVAADYALSDLWTVGAVAAATLGGRRTDQGSLPQAATVILKLARYF